MTSRASDEHDPLTVYLYETHREALHLVKDGGEALPLLVEAVEEINDTPLDEGAGEGYHRSTHLDKTTPCYRFPVSQRACITAVY